MSDGNRRKIVAAIIGLALAIGLGAVSYQLYKASEQRDTGYTYQPADEASVGVVGTSKALAKAYQPKCKNPQNDKDADLCAQWAAVEQVAEANRLTSLNAKMAIASLVATAIATFLLLWTLWETRQISRRELRAYVKLEPIKSSGIVEVGKLIQLNLDQIDYGHTPAINCEFHYASAVRSVDWDWSDEIIGKREGKRKITIHRDSPSSMTIFSKHPMTAEEMHGIKIGALKIVARGTLFYDDVFGGSHYTQIGVEIGSAELEQKRVRLAAFGNIST